MPEGKYVARKLIPYCTVIGDGSSSWVMSSIEPGGSWEVIDNGSPAQFLVYRDYIDIQGYTDAEVTAFIMGVNFQESNTWLGLGFLPTGAVHTWDMLTTEYINDNQFTTGNMTGPYSMWNPPGMMDSNYDLQQILYGRYRTFSPDTTVTGGLVGINRQTWGCGDATAADRLYLTRVVLLAGQIANTANDHITVPPSAIVVPLAAVKEKNLVHMERLRRSYVLAENRHG